MSIAEFVHRGAGGKRHGVRVGRLVVMAIPQSGGAPLLDGSCTTLVSWRIGDANAAALEEALAVCMNDRDYSDHAARLTAGTALQDARRVQHASGVCIRGWLRGEGPGRALNISWIGARRSLNPGRWLRWRTLRARLLWELRGRPRPLGLDYTARDFDGAGWAPAAPVDRWPLRDATHCAPGEPYAPVSS